jgi:Flp pilus assembly protein TadB
MPPAGLEAGAVTAPPTKLHFTMAQTKRKRRTKHRGTAAGTIQTRGRTGRPLSADEKKKQTRLDARERRLNTPPTWKSAATRAALAAVLMFVFLALVGPKHDRIESALLFALFALALYVPGGYYMELWLYRRRQKRKQQVAK